MGYVAVTVCLLVKAGDFLGSEKHWPSSLQVWSQELFSGLLSYLLTWTLSYALVHGSIAPWDANML